MNIRLEEWLTESACLSALTPTNSHQLVRTAPSSSTSLVSGIRRLKYSISISPLLYSVVFSLPVHTQMHTQKRNRCTHKCAHTRAHTHMQICMRSAPQNYLCAIPQEIKALSSSFTSFSPSQEVNWREDWILQLTTTFGAMSSLHRARLTSWRLWHWAVIAR